jgi:hypothetical protein
MRIVHFRQIVDGKVRHQRPASGWTPKAVFTRQSAVKRNSRLLVELRQPSIIEMMLRIEITEARHYFYSVTIDTGIE